MASYKPHSSLLNHVKVLTLYAVFQMYFFQTATHTPVPTLAPNHTAAIFTNKTH